jgi:hypothetical protein
LTGADEVQALAGLALAAHGFVALDPDPLEMVIEFF